MARSRKRTPIHGMTTAESDKPFKRNEHRRERRIVRSRLKAIDELPPPKAFGNPWKSDKDGKHYWADMPESGFRK